MTRFFVLAGLFVSAPVWACPGSSDCTSDHCKMKSAEETTAATDAVEAAEGTSVTMSVAGMKCGACSDKVTAALKALEGVNEAAVDHVAGTATVKVDGEKVTNDQLLAAVTALGYEVSLSDS